jgi:hypothetical protein
MLRHRTVGIFELDFQRHMLDAEIQIFDSGFALTLDALRIVACQSFIYDGDPLLKCGQFVKG